MILKLKILLPFLALFLILSSCGVSKSITDNDKEAYRILNTISDLSVNKHIYYRTLNNINGDFVLSDYIKPGLLDFSLCKKSIDKSNILNDSNYKFISSRFKVLKSVKIDNSLIKDKSIIIKNKGKTNTIFMTFPIIFNNGKYAIFYLEERYGGEFTLLKKDRNKWERICSSNVWIE